jgi:argininosuccinate lyase
VRTALDSGRSLSSLSSEELALHSDLLGQDSDEYYAIISQRSWLESKVSEGGTGLQRVREQLVAARDVLDAPQRP